MDLAAIRALWEAGDSKEASRAIYDALPVQRRGRWAADVLDLVCTLIPAVPAQIKAVIAIGRAGRLWDAHDAFSAVRELTLAADRGAGAGIYSTVLGIAEDAAKVMYNATGVDEPVAPGVKAPFDEECGYWLAGGLAHLARQGSAEFARRTWEVHECWLNLPWWRFW